MVNFVVIKKVDKLFCNKLFLILLFILLYLILYYYFYSCKLISPDEGYQLALNNHSFKEIIYYCSVDYHVPLFAFLVKIFSYLPVDVIVSSRILLSLIIIVHFFVAFYPLERLTGNRGVSIIYSAVLLFSPLLAYFVLNIRMFSLANLNLFLVFIYSCFCFRDDRKSDWIKLFFVSFLSCYSFLLSTVVTLFCLLCMFCYCMFKSKKDLAKKFFICGVLVFLSFSPWIPILFNQFVGVTSDRYWNFFPSSMFRFLFELTTLFITSYNNSNPVSGEVWATFLVVILLVCFYIFLSRRNKNFVGQRFILKLLLLLLLFSFFFILGYCYINQTFASRYFTILYSLVLFFVIYYFICNFKKIILPVLVIFFLCFYFNFSFIIKNEILSNDGVEILATYFEDYSSGNDEEVYIYHLSESSLEVMYEDYFYKYNNFVVYDNDYETNQINVLKDYSIFGNGVYVLDDILDISNYTDEFFLILISDDYRVNEVGNIFFYLVENKYEYELVGQFSSDYNRVVYNLYRVNINDIDGD